MNTKNEELIALKKALKREQKKNEALKAKLAAEKADKKKALREAKKRRFAVADIFEKSGRCPENHVRRHRFVEELVRLSVLLYCYAGISSRQVRKSLECFSLVFDCQTDEIPSHQTVLDWVGKCGLDLNQSAHSGQSLKDIDYSLIMDNSISVGGHDLHVELALPAKHPGHALTCADVRLLDMKVATKWNACMLQDELLESMHRVGHKPQYVVTDNARLMTRPLSNLGVANHRDLSHTLGVFLEQVYDKDEAFLDFSAKLGMARKYVHTDIAYLMPPKKRTIARFMNLFDIVEWAHKILSIDYELNSMERLVCEPCLKHASLVEELYEIMSVYKTIESILKARGLSESTAEECRLRVRKALWCGTPRQREIGERIIKYIDTESSLLEGPDAVHNICSDIIESIFGLLKNRLSPNPNAGFTKQILLIPLHLRLSDYESCKGFSVAPLLERSTLTKLNHWRHTTLLESNAKKRSKILKNHA